MAMKHPAESEKERITVRTAGDVDALLPAGARYRAWDEIEKGLCVRVMPTGAKVWWYEYRDPKGKRQSVKLGPAGDKPGELKPGEARKKVKGLGADPAATRREERAEAQRAREHRQQRHTRLLQTYLEGAYWRHHLRAKRSGVATKARLMVDWADLLNKSMDEIVPLDIERIRRKRVKKGTLPQTINRSWNDLRALLNCAASDKVIRVNPIAQGEIKALKVEDDKRIRWLGQRDGYENIKDEEGRKVGERARLLSALDRAPDYLRVITHVALFTGMRRGEIFSLTWGAVDFQRDQITVLAHTTKGAKTRYLPMHIDLRARMLAWRGDRRVKANQLVVPNPSTKKRFVTVKKAWAALLADASVEDFHLHDCRHDFASRLVMNGVDLYTVRDLLGHSTIQLTERYSHLSPDKHKAALEVL